eukprot:3990474-Pyramimonas_sp.AAC.1
MDVIGIRVDVVGIGVDVVGTFRLTSRLLRGGWYAILVTSPRALCDTNTCGCVDSPPSCEFTRHSCGFTEQASVADSFINKPFCLLYEGLTIAEFSVGKRSYYQGLNVRVKLACRSRSRRLSRSRGTMWMLRATVWMLRATIWMLRVTVWMLRVVV